MKTQKRWVKQLDEEQSYSTDVIDPTPLAKLRNRIEKVQGSTSRMQS